MYDSENALSHRNSAYCSVGMPIVSKLKPPPQHNLKQKESAKIMQIYNKHLLKFFLLNRLCFCHIDLILKWYNLTNCKKRRRIKIYFPLLMLYSQVVTGR